ncbi:MAG: Efem/EfeO family lipoprotein precursor [Nocardioides sp.]|nr:Efem/EfeO family lipoprotein precursor [Nocardioides sp.]
MRIPLLVAALLATPALAACTQNATTKDAGDDRSITVTSTDDRCEVSSTEAPSGTLAFQVTNDGSQVTEFYLYAEDGERIMGEVENVGPGLSRELTVSVAPGSYVTACKPGMKGKGIRGDLTVTDSGAEVASESDDVQVEHATDEYQAWVQDESDQLLAQTRKFVAAYKSGDDRTAKALYPVARTHWERIETVAESFGDLDPKMDAREADLEPGQKWTGWHRIEKDLWPARAEKYAALSAKQRATYADDLLANTETLDGRIGKLEFTVDQIANGSRGLLEEVATGKVTGEEEYWSRTDLWDFQANVDGAKKAFEVLEPVLASKDPDLEETLDQRFEALQELLDEQRVGDGFRFYDELAPEEIKALADAVNALSEPLSKLTAAVLS